MCWGISNLWGWNRFKPFQSPAPWLLLLFQRSPLFSSSLPASCSPPSTPYWLIRAIATSQSDQFRSKYTHASPCLTRLTNCPYSAAYGKINTFTEKKSFFSASHIPIFTATPFYVRGHAGSRQVKSWCLMIFTIFVLVHQCWQTFLNPEPIAMNSCWLVKTGFWRKR